MDGRGVTFYESYPARPGRPSGNLATIQSDTAPLPAKQKAQRRRIRRRKANRVNSALPPVQPANALAPRHSCSAPDSLLSVSAFSNFPPTSVVRRNLRIASLHLSSAKSSGVLIRFFLV